MKTAIRYALGLFLFASIGSAANAATASNSGKPWAVSPVLGLTSFSIKGADISGARGGLQAGAMFTYQSGVEDLSYETGLNYTQAGAKDDALLASVEYRLDYLAVPLGARYSFMQSQDSASHWYTRAGMTLAYLVKASQKAQLFGATAEEDVTGKMGSLDVLPYLGLGYAWDFGSNQVVSIDFNYTRGLMKVIKDVASNSEGLILGASYEVAF